MMFEVVYEYLLSSFFTIGFSKLPLLLGPREEGRLSFNIYHIVSMRHCPQNVLIIVKKIKFILLVCIADKSKTDYTINRRFLPAFSKNPATPGMPIPYFIRTAIFFGGKRVLLCHSLRFSAKNTNFFYMLNNKEYDYDLLR